MSLENSMKSPVFRSHGVSWRPMATLRKALIRCLPRLRRSSENLEARTFVVLEKRRPNASGKFWPIRRGGAFSGADGLEFRASARLDQLPRMAAAAEDAAQVGGYQLAAAAHAANGVLRCWLAPTGDSPSPAAAWDTFREGCRKGASPQKGRAVHLSLSGAPDSLRTDTEVWGEDVLQPAMIDLTRRLKAEYDPMGTLSPGRFVARI